MYGLHDQNDILIQKQAGNESGFIEIPDDAVCGQIRQGDGSYIDPPASPPTLEQQRQSAMQTGVEFGGVMCSAFKEDQFGLSSIKPYVLEGMSFDFEFENGNVLNINPSNISAFEAVWFPFRLAHTKVNFNP